MPLSMVATMAGYIAKNKLRPRAEWQKTVVVDEDSSNPFRIIHTLRTDGERDPHPMINKRFPIVLMLEPLHACNLTCTGCGRIREYESTIRERLTAAECIAASDECGAPIVSICGGEPFLHPEIHTMTAGIIEKGRHVILCTNGMFLRKKAKDFKPSTNLFFNVHLDGLQKNHDIAVEREGVYAEAIEGIKHAKSLGFQVMTNTTVYKETDMNEIWQLFEYLETLGVDGHAISPAYGYSAVNDREIFMTRDDIVEKFKDIEKFDKRFPLTHNPVFLEFLSGKRELPCTAWGNPTYNVKGWKGPCYLITDNHYKTFEDLMTKTRWNDYGAGNDPRCEHCMVHCGYEPSAALGINGKFMDTFKQISWLLSK
ncbi:hopanoid biosynthesis associated radical SAM protein HpnH [Bryobacterales bacterium F-183]|nr:hopanoid biosynthesis associated radical SAM protein HpnH [Bryobacterales bacterium F-183]